jgi:hypothetical protein
VYKNKRASIARGGRSSLGAVPSGKYPPTTLAFSRKTLPKNNILIGDDPAQLRFMEQQLNKEITYVDEVTDEMLLGYEGLLVWVSAEHHIDISPDVKRHTGIWDAGPILKGSAGAHAIVRHAALILKITEKLSRETMDFVATEITKHGLEDVRGALWLAVWALTGDTTPEPTWLEPWQDPIRWLSPGTDPAHRLMSLYRTLVGWGFLVTGEPRGLKQLRITPAHQAYLQTLKLDRDRVYESIKVISIWKIQRFDPHICTLRIASIWCG